jgi:hypothetical protein
MSGAQRINKVIELLEAFALGEIDLSEERIRVALRLLDFVLDDLPPDDGGYEAEPVIPDYRPVLAFSRDFAA